MSKIKDFFKKNLRDIATVVGFAVGGPAGAAIGQGIGSLAEGRDPMKSLMSAGKVYGGSSFAQGLGLQGGQGIGSLNPLSNQFMLRPSNIGAGATQYGEGVGGFFEGLGGAARGSLAEGQKLGEAFGNLSALQKLGVLGVGASTVAGMQDEGPPATMPASTSGYLTQGLRPATLSNVYGTGGIPMVSSGMPGGSMDPISQTYLDLLARQDKDYGDINFPTFSQQRLTANQGGIARLADGGELPEVDLRFTGGGTNDPMGSGDEDTIPALLADGEFVMTKQAVKGIGNGNHSKGIEMLYAMMDNNEKKAQNMGLGRA